jgi:hypothetical protein
LTERDVVVDSLRIAMDFFKDGPMANRLEELTASPGSAAPTTRGRIAEITAVPTTDARYLLNSFNTGMATGLTLLPILVGAFSLLGGVGVGISIYGKVPVAATILIGLGILCSVLSVVALVAYQQFLAGRYLRWIARWTFSRRSDLLVRPDDPEAVFIDIIPRSHWGEAMVEPATDMGFFTIDHDHRELLFEGDVKRYRIPFEAVGSCQIEEYSLGHEQWKADVHFVTVLTVETATGPREIPLSGRHLEFRSRRAAERRLQAHAFCNRILMALNA